MKRLFSILLCLLCVMSVALFGCSSNENPEETTTITSENEDIDIDISRLNSTMAYSQIYDMVAANPESYIGNTVKIKGKYQANYFEETDNYYHFIIIDDATACCQQGMEFIWKDHIYPEDFPNNDDIITVIGTFMSYDELGVTYYCLDVSELTTE